MLRNIVTQVKFYFSPIKRYILGRSKNIFRLIHFLMLTSVNDVKNVTTLNIFLAQPKNYFSRGLKSGLTSVNFFGAGSTSLGQPKFCFSRGEESGPQSARPRKNDSDT